MRAIASVPGASFQEQAVAKAITKSLRTVGIRTRPDRSGNLFVRLGPKKSRKPPMVWVAHMDHPALVIQEKYIQPPRRPVAEASSRYRAGAGRQENLTKLKPITTFLAKAMGDVPVIQLVGKSLPLFRLDKNRIKTVGRAQVIQQKKEGVLLKISGNAKEGDFCRAWPGKFKLSSSWIQGPALDDLAGCAGIISALVFLKKQAVGRPIIAIFTRAEEVGLVGATDVARSRALPRNAQVFSVEMSRHLPGAEPGKGAVIRLGDRSGLFDPALSDALVQQARLVGDEIPLQATLLSGGVCEASSFRAFGFKTTGLACPLVGYHNRGSKTSVPEKIRVKDYFSLVAFIRWVCLSPGDFLKPGNVMRKRLLQRHRQYRKSF